MAEVNNNNWKQNEVFLQYLRFQYSPSRDAADAAMKLLPMAVAESRMLGSLQNLLLREAFELFNRPAQRHHFAFNAERQRWQYMGTHTIPKNNIIVVIGKLVRNLRPGQFTLVPQLEIIQELSGFNVP